MFAEDVKQSRAFQKRFWHTVPVSLNIIHKDDMLVI